MITGASLHSHSSPLTSSQPWPEERAGGEAQDAFSTARQVRDEYEGFCKVGSYRKRAPTIEGW